ncbi:MAG: hypothetical protein ACRC8W_06625 [Plesiomonas shigelloides]
MGNVRLILSANNNVSQTRIGFSAGTSSVPMRIGFSYALTTTYTDVNRIKTGRIGPTTISNTVVYPVDTTANVGHGDKIVFVVFCHDTLEAWEVTVAGVAAKTAVGDTNGRLAVHAVQISGDSELLTGKVYNP